MPTGVAAGRHCVDGGVRCPRDRGAGFISGDPDAEAQRARSDRAARRSQPRSPTRTTARSTAAPARFTGAFGNRGANAGATGATGPTGGAAGAAPAPASNGTTGQIKLVDGSNIYITTSDGSTVKVTTTPTSKVTKWVAGAVGDLKAGDTITVPGAAGSDGTIAASSISQAP